MLRMIYFTYIAFLLLWSSGCAINEVVTRTATEEISAINQMERELRDYKMQWEAEQMRALQEFSQSINGFRTNTLSNALTSSSLEAVDRLFRIPSERIDSTMVTDELVRIYQAQVAALADADTKEAKLKKAFSHRLQDIDALEVRLDKVKNGVKRAGQSAETRQQLGIVIEGLQKGKQSVSDEE